MSAFDSCTFDEKRNVLSSAVTPDYHWRGLHPFHEQKGADAVFDTFWAPFCNSFNAIERRELIFFAGLNDCDDQATTWTCSMGHFKALFDHAWLGIRPTNKMVLIRYAEFHRIEGDKIAETALFIDILDLIYQAGLWPLPPMTAAASHFPGPLTNDGQLFDAQDPVEGEKTLRTILDMAGNIAKANEILQGKSDAKPLTPQEELQLTWTENMSWYGPAGIGSTFTIDRYVEQHQAPFRVHNDNRVFNGHVARFAEGHYGGFFGWPNLTITPTGGYMGLPGSNKPSDMRVVDVYRREGDLLAENWIFIDMLHFLNQQGLDVLARIATVPRT